MWVYPYNFVPYDEAPKRLQPPTRENLKGLSGRLDCVLRNLTPMLVPDPELAGRIPAEKGFHRVADFFQVGGRLAIPPASLKGMVRSVAEAVTNSCFSTFRRPDAAEMKEGRFLWRRDAGANRQSGKLQAVAGGGWEFVPYAFPNAKPKVPIYLAAALTPRPSQTNPTAIANLVCEKLHSNTDIVTSFQVAGVTRDAHEVPVTTGVVRAFGDGRRAVEVPRAALGLGAHGTVQVKIPTAFPAAGIPAPGTPVHDVRLVRTWEPRAGHAPHDPQHCWRVRSFRLAPGGPHLTVPRVTLPGTGWIVPPPDFELRQGYAGDKRFRNLRFHAVLGGTARPAIPLPDDLVEDFRRICEVRYNKSLRDTGGVAGTAASEVATPIANQWVTCQFDAARQPMALGPVAVLLERYQKHPAELLGGAMQPCRNPARLCPCCRLFGGLGKDYRDNPWALSGRVSIGPAWSDVVPGEANTRWLPLRILGSPKPSYFPFYLEGDRGTPVNYNGERVYPGGARRYNPGDPTRLRGRKFYWHQSPKDPGGYGIESDNFTHGEEPGNFPHTNQNMTGRVLTELNQEFRFAVTFENLSQAELGLLLWSLELETGLAHKLGHGRPLGLGSVEVKVDKLFLFESRFANIDEPAEAEDTARKGEFVQAFKTASEFRSPANQATFFDDLSYVKGLLSMLSWEERPDGEFLNHHVDYLPPGAHADTLPEVLRNRKIGKRPAEPQVLENPGDLWP